MACSSRRVLPAGSVSMSAPASGTRVPCRAGATAPQGCGSPGPCPSSAQLRVQAASGQQLCPPYLMDGGGVTTQFPRSVLPASFLIFSSALLLTVPQSHETHREAGGHHAHHRAMWQVPQGTPQGPGKAAGSDREGRVTVPEWTCAEGRATGRGGWGLRCVCGDVRAPACLQSCM